MKIHYYTYDAAAHCADCARNRFEKDVNAPDYLPSNVDENYIPYDTIDGENNPIGVVFTTDENPARMPLESGGASVSCDTCGKLIEAHHDAIVIDVYRGVADIAQRSKAHPGIEIIINDWDNVEC